MRRKFESCRERQIIAALDRLYDFVQPPIFGGQFAVEDITTMDFVVSINVAGQLLGRVRQLPPGSAITGFQIDDS